LLIYLVENMSVYKIIQKKPLRSEILKTIPDEPERTAVQGHFREIEVESSFAGATA
jgi:hypothetical protein